MKRIVCFTFIFVLTAGIALAQNFNLFYQGRLLDADGNPVTRLTIFEFKICQGDDEVTPCTTPPVCQPPAVAILPGADGKFTQQIGPCSLSSLDMTAPIFLEVKVDNRETVLPRKKIVLGQDLAASDSFFLESVATVGARGIVDTGDALFGGNVSVNGDAFFNRNVGIGTTSPSAGLHVANGGVRVSAPAEVNIDTPSMVGGRLKILNNGNVGIGATNPPDRLVVAGGIGFNNSSDRDPEPVGHLGAARNSRVGTSPTVIITLDQGTGALAIVTGGNVDDPMQPKVFTDLVWVVSTVVGRTITVLQSSTVSGGPADRSYSVLNGRFRLAMSSGVYNVTVAMIGS